jgi:Zn-dependent protease with chaperone function
MDFFARQDRARRNTKVLVFYFAMAVAMIIASVYLACLLVFFGLGKHPGAHGPEPAIVLWNAQLFGIVVLGTLSVIAGGSLYKTAALSGGGLAVAQSLGGRLISTDTQDFEERKLLNVVEEMAIASGIPAPPVYVMDEEEGINALAAGYTPNDAVIGVTRGCIKRLSRDELQGVVGHEFSHILNGDMRLNLRLMGLIFGILCLATLGRILLHTRGRKNPLPILGLALILIGALGVFFGRLIQAAVSRQREFLADASAVQFTRNPLGLSSALQKIGGLPNGSRLQSDQAVDASHLFFGSVLRFSLFGILSTHPRLEDRIRAIDPSWDGKFPRGTLPQDDFPRMADAASAVPIDSDSAIRQRRRGDPSGLISTVVNAASILPQLGNPNSLHLRYAVEMRQSFPEAVRRAAHEPGSTTALIYALLISTDESIRTSQLQQLATCVTPEIYQRTLALLPEVGVIAQRVRLPLVSLSLPALRRLSQEEFQHFTSQLQWIIESDQQIDLFEFVLLKIMRRHLNPQYTQVSPDVVQFYAIKPLLPDCAVILSALAHLGGREETEVRAAFVQGLPSLRSPQGELGLLSQSECGLEQIDAALTRLAQASPQIKKQLIEACARVVGSDGLIQEHEAELLRAIADTLDCPIPPFIPADFS